MGMRSDRSPQPYRACSGLYWPGSVLLACFSAWSLDNGLWEILCVRKAEEMDAGLMQHCLRSTPEARSKWQPASLASENCQRSLDSSILCSWPPAGIVLRRLWPSGKHSTHRAKRVPCTDVRTYAVYSTSPGYLKVKGLGKLYRRRHWCPSIASPLRRKIWGESIDSGGTCEEDSRCTL